MTDTDDFKIRLAGRGVPEDMAPGEYLARCIDAEVKRRGNQTRAVLTFRCEAGRFDGVLLYHWLPIHGTVAAHHKFARAYSVAVGRELHADEELSLREFVGKLYVVHVGFRKTSGKKFRLENTRERKDSSDFLRVHQIVSLVVSATTANEPDEQQGSRTQTRKARRLVKLSSREARRGATNECERASGAPSRAGIHSAL